MPTLPTYDNFVAQPDALPGVRVRPSSEGAQQQEMGQAFLHAGSQIQQMVVAEEQRANLIRVDDALNKTKLLISDATYNPQTGYLVQRGENAFPKDKPLDVAYGEKLQQSVQDIADGLGNDAQKRLYMQHAGNALTDFRAGVQRHSADEFHKYSVATNNATIDISADSAARAWNNLDDIQRNLDAAKNAVVKNAELAGVPTDSPIVKEQLQKVESQVHTKVIAAALEADNTDYAGRYFNVFAKQMSADDILRVQGTIQRQQDAHAAIAATDAAMSTLAPKIAPTPGGQFVHVIAKVESNAQDFNADGTPVVSPKGAKYAMQVMPDTAKKPGFGIAPAANDTPEEYNRVGREYLGALLQKYDGDPAKACAAYNAGPGAVDAAVKVGGADWLSKLPAETRAYVPKALSMLGTADARPPTPTRQDFHDAALAALGPNPSTNLRKLTLDEATRRYDDYTKALAQRGSDAVTAAQQWFIANPGKGLADLPPSLKQPVADNAPDKMDNLISFAKALGNPARETDLAVYNALWTNKEAMAAMPADKFMHLVTTKLSDGDAKMMIKARQDYIEGGTDESFRSLNDAAMNKALEARLQMLGVNTSPKKDDKEANAYLGGVRKFLRDDILTMQQALGRKLTPADIQQHVDELFAKSVGFRKTVFGVPFGGVSNVSIMSPEFSPPSDEAAQIKQYLIDHGNAAPTEADITNQYRRLHARR